MVGGKEKKNFIQPQISELRSSEGRFLPSKSGFLDPRTNTLNNLLDSKGCLKIDSDLSFSLKSEELAHYRSSHPTDPDLSIFPTHLNFTVYYK